MNYKNNVDKTQRMKNKNVKKYEKVTNNESNFRYSLLFGKSNDYVIRYFFGKK